ncbi:MAG: type III-B CRISPR module RAMP protein Cmr1 [Planctomycetaceae bacterium]
MSIGKRAIPTLADVPPATSDAVHRTFTIQFAVPCLGGGTKAGQIDPKFPVRASSIRGHLRFWWRLLNASAFQLPDGATNLPALRRREQEIFGGPDFPSPLRLHVTHAQPRPDTRSANDYFGFDRFGPECYALFPPLNDGDKTKAQQSQIIKEGFQFDLRLTWPSQQRLDQMRAAQNADRLKMSPPQPPLPPNIQDPCAEIQQAVLAWLTWGGLGARTRRGVGSLHCVKWPAEIENPAPLAPPPGCRLFLYAPRKADANWNALEAWQTAVRIYRDFRQSFRRPPTGANRFPGRSRWPEPDSIRMLTECSDPDHSEPLYPLDQPLFPRAVLGLPIGFKFKSGPKDNAQQHEDPARVTLAPTGKDRMASPVITTAVFADGQWKSAILILPYHAALSMNCTLKDTAGPARWDTPQRQAVELETDVSPQQIAGPSLAGLSSVDTPLAGNPNAIEALIAFLKRGRNGQGKDLPVFSEWSPAT